MDIQIAFEQVKNQLAHVGGPAKKKNYISLKETYLQSFFKNIRF